MGLYKHQRETVKLRGFIIKHLWLYSCFMLTGAVCVIVWKKSFEEEEHFME